ncbi:MAG: hypothetical protein V1870_02340 [Candidatus Aenigmatarchaeota archaeon]
MINNFETVDEWKDMNLVPFGKPSVPRARAEVQKYCDMHKDYETLHVTDHPSYAGLNEYLRTNKYPKDYLGSALVDLIDHRTRKHIPSPLYVTVEHHQTSTKEKDLYIVGILDSPDTNSRDVRTKMLVSNNSNTNELVEKISSIESEKGLHVFVYTHEKSLMEIKK